MGLIVGGRDHPAIIFSFAFFRKNEYHIRSSARTRMKQNNDKSSKEQHPFMYPTPQRRVLCPQHNQP
jgi:hypothetical protein